MKCMNEPYWESPYLKGKDLRLELAGALEVAQLKFFDARDNRMNYQGLAVSEEYKHLFRVVRSLPTFSLMKVEGRVEQLAFWLNIYNTLVINIIVEERMEDGPMTLEGFYNSHRYNIDGKYFSLDDIEHGILRANTPKYMSLSGVFSRTDPRLDYVLKQADPRVHFAFACGACSCPPLRAYFADRVDRQLDEAVTGALDRWVELDRGQIKLDVPKLFHWYKKDFGEDGDIVKFIIKHLQDPDSRNYLAANAQRIDISFLDFNWDLNSMNGVTT